MNLLFKVLLNNSRDLFKYLDPEDHKNLSVAFLDDYILYLLDRVNYKPNAAKDHYFEFDDCSNSMVKKEMDYDFVLKMVLESIDINRLRTSTLNLLHRGFWNHVSLNCRLKEKFVYKWSHKINMLKFKLNKNCRGFGGEYGQLLPRPFSKKFRARFPGIETYKPCFICFEDTDYHYSSFLIDNDWMCEDCMYEEDDDIYDEWYDDSDYLPSDRHWSEDDTDYEDYEL